MSRHLTFEDFALRIAARGADGLTTEILRSPGGGGHAPLRLPAELGDLSRVLRAAERMVRSRGPEARDVHLGAEPARPGNPTLDPREMGGLLFDALLTGRVRDSFRFGLGSVRRQLDRGLRLRLVYDPSDPEVAAVAALPWELLFDAEGAEFLSRNVLTPVVRCLDVTQPDALPRAGPPVGILVTGANPPASEPLDLAAEGARLRAALSTPDAEVEVLADTRLEELRARLRDGSFQVLHFMGHGDFDEVTGEGCLLFSGPDGGRRPVSGRLLAETLRGIPSLRLVVLNACESARFPRRAGLDPYSGVAAALVAAGLPSVLAMQFPISDRAAIEFSSAFYSALAAGDQVDAAVAEGRLAIHRAEEVSLEWATPVLFTRVVDAAILERPTGDRATTAASIRSRVLDSSILVQEKTRGFVGRRFVFEAFDRFLESSGGGYFELVGDPGIGKTALVAELVRTRGWPHHFNVRSAGIYRPEAFLSNVCAQLIAAYELPYGSLPPDAVRNGAFLQEILGAVSRRLGPEKPAVLLVDALDESDLDGLPAGVNPLFLPATLPPGVFILLTSRPLASDRKPRIDGAHERLALEPDSEENLRDIGELLETWIERPGVRDRLGLRGITDRQLVETLVVKSEGNFMYLSHVLRELDRGLYRDLSPAELPAGLESYYEDHWRRMRGRDEAAWLGYKLPVLEALAVVDEPLGLEMIQAFSGVGDRHRVRQVLDEWRPFLAVTQAHDSDSGRHLYRLYHRSFFDFIVAKDELADDPVDLRAARVRLFRAMSG